MPALEPHPTTPLRGPLWACSWYAISLGAWLASWRIESFGESSTAALTSLVVLTEVISVAVRLSPLARPGARGLDPSDRSASQLTWLCGWGAQVNALGLVAMLSPSLQSVLPGLIVTAVIEGLALSKAPFDWRVATRSVAGGAQSDAEPAQDLPTGEADGERWTRSTQEGVAETGQRFLSGWVRFELAADQKALALSVGFAPAFPAAPEVELDQEADSEESHCEESHCEALLEHVTPAGMRVAIKRTTTGSSLAGKLHWHASQSEADSQGEYPARLRSGLP